MILFPFAKINLGLRITSLRTDGYHNIETVFYPVKRLTDTLDVIESDKMDFKTTGLPINGSDKDNLVLKAYELLKSKYSLPPVKILLEKNIPMGAGLGGGSSDGAHMLILLNSLFNLNISTEQLMEYALLLGSDCPFFIYDKPAFAMGRGEILHDVKVNLGNFHMIIVKPSVSVSTAEAYEGVTPTASRLSLKGMIAFPIGRWNGNILNQFETSVFKSYPEIKEIKDTLYDKGAVFALMSGSGSAVYGLFNYERKNMEKFFPPDYQIFSVKL